MRQSSIIILTVLVVQAYSAPQFITFSDGKLGVNFGGYHAGVGLGGLAGGNSRAAGGLYAEAGTPFGPAARAGLGGAVDGNSGTAGGLYAGATAGGGVNAAAGLGGAVAGGKSIGGGYSSAQAGGKSATAVLGGESGVSGSSGFSISAHKSIEVPTTVVKETEVYGEAKLESANEITPSANAGVEANVNANVNVNAQPGFVKEVHVEPTPQTVYVRKHKPHRHHLHKTVYVGGYAGLGGDVAVPETKTVVYKTVQPIEKRVDVDVEAHGGAGASVNAEHYGPVKGVTYNKEVVVNSKPSTFFQDIFNIPISTLKAVSGFLTNTAENTGVSVQKSATFKTGGYSGFSGNAGFSGHSGYSSYY